MRDAIFAHHRCMRWQLFLLTVVGFGPGKVCGQILQGHRGAAFKADEGVALVAIQERSMTSEN